jgi:hypothetical protein
LLLTCLIKLMKRKIDEHPMRWHEVLSEALWAYRISCHGATKTSPYHLVYGQEAVLPWEITVGSRRIEFQNDLMAEEYVALMNDNIKDLTELRLWSLEKIKENKAKVADKYRYESVKGWPDLHDSRFKNKITRCRNSGDN